MHRTGRYIPELSGKNMPVIGSWPSEKSKLFSYSLGQMDTGHLFGNARKKECACEEHEKCGCCGC